MRPRVVVYTTVLGPDTDSLKIPTVHNKAVRYICYTDHEGLGGGGVWRIRRHEYEGCPIRESRRIKINSHRMFPRVDATLWIDAAFELMMDPVDIAHRWLWKADMMALAHPHRTKVVDEGVAIVKLRKAKEKNVNRQLARFGTKFLAGQEVITSTGLCLRRNCEQVARFNRRWWLEFLWAKHTRDQMSVDYAAWRSGISIKYLRGHYKDNPYAQWYPH